MKCMINALAVSPSLPTIVAVGQNIQTIDFFRRKEIPYNLT